MWLAYRPLQIRDLSLFLPVGFPDQAADSEFGKELEPPPRNEVIFTVSSVGVVIVEDCFDCFGRFPPDRRLRDVDFVVGVVGEDGKARFSKGRITAPAYRASPAVETASANSRSSRMYRRMFSRVGGIEMGLPLASSCSSVHDSMPWRM
jgi:hypothetical protein